MSVNRPTDPKQRDADIENKLRLFGIYNAFSKGKFPSNQQIDVALNSALESKALSSPSEKLSDEGKHLIKDLKAVINEAKLLLLVKNHDQAIQEFVWHAQQAAITTTVGPGPNAPVSQDQAKQDGQNALAGLRTLGTLAITNGQFRKLISDAMILLRDIASDAAQKAGGRIQPSAEELAQIDTPAEDNTWHEAPNMSRGALRERAKGAFNKNAPINTQDAQQAAENAAAAAHPEGGNRSPRALAEQVAREKQRDGVTRIDVRAALDTARNHLEASKDDEKFQQQKDKVNETANQYKRRASDYLKGKMPQERRDQTIYRLKKMVVEIQGHEDYQQAIDTLLYLAETYAGHTKNISQQTGDSIDSVHDNNHLKCAETLLRTLLERFANNTSANDLFDAINDIYKDADKDPELKNWFKEVDNYIRRCLKQQGFILTDVADNEYDELYDHGRFLLRERYRSHTDRLVDELKFLGDQFAQDPQNAQLKNAVTKLLNDLGKDEKGKAVFKKHLVNDITGVIVPGLFESVRYIPIPRIEYSDKQVDVIIENLIVEGDNLMPNVLEFGNDSYFRWGRKNIASKNKQKVMLAVSGVQCDLKDVSFYIKKKHGFPTLSDTGLMDIFLGGEGFSFTIRMSSADKTDRANFFQVDKVDVSIKHMNIKLKQSRHKVLFTIFKPMLLKVVRPALQKVLEKQIKTSFLELDRKIYTIKMEADKVAEDLKENPDPEKATNVFQRYFSAAQHEFTQKKEKVKEVTEDKKANFAVTQEDSIFKNIKLPSGNSNVATKYKKMATEGERWESPVFSIGEAQETTNTPKPVEVTRKSHGSSKAQLPSRSPTNGVGVPAHTQAQRVALPPSPPAESRMFKLAESRKLIAIQGVDAVPFLNGITTNTLPDAKSVEGLYSGFLTAQGRVLYDVFIYPTNHTRNLALINGSDDPAFLIDVGAALAPELLRHLRRYKLRSKFTASLIDGFDVWSVPNSFRVGDTAPSSTAAHLRIGCVDPRAPGMGRRVVLPSTFDDAAAVAFEDVPTTAADDEVAYRLKRYLLGVPEAPGEIISGSALPQESNMDYMSGINFHKGCYLGQELTIRTRHTGVVRKRILPVQLYTSSSTRPAVDGGAPVYDPSFTPLVPLTVGGNISRVNKKARSVGKFLGNVGNIGLALCRLEIMTNVSLGEGPGFDPEVDEFKVDTDVGEGGEVRLKAFVPEWHTTGTITNEVV
ncbi:hypothetical protein Dda_2771 [Drechslerella dactyloides]|uniref:Iron-sulfur cluster assembly factor IBA57 homolog, mitochondrial n=1 Tax=Drechslerella dactyloides TaxID=74499 RepID=A0AAD6NL62_DREDA|nr:hypothetical protein Dda_2771 [Drechslerella dactyloides]